MKNCPFDRLGLVQHYLRKAHRRQKLVVAKLNLVEELMTTAAEQINAVTEKLDDLAADVRVLKDKQGQLDAEGQAALDRLSSKLTELDSSVGDQDGSDNPVVENPDVDENGQPIVR